MKKAIGILFAITAVYELVKMSFGSAAVSAVIAWLLLRSPRGAKAKTQTRGAAADDYPVIYQDPPIPVGFLEYLQATGQYDPRFSGRNNALGYVLSGCTDTQRAEFWAYAVDCALHNRIMGNILAEPNLQRYYDFAEYACRDASLFYSIRKKAPYEYWEPGRRSIAWESAAKWFR